MISVAALDAVLYSDVAPDVSNSSAHERAWNLLVQWMGPHDEPKEPNDDIAIALSYLPDLEIQLVENYEGAVSSHFTTNVMPLLLQDGANTTALETIQSVLSKLRKWYLFPLEAAGFSSLSKARLGRTVTALLRMAVPRKRLVEALSSPLESRTESKPLGLSTAYALFIECGLTDEVEEALSNVLIQDVRKHVHDTFAGKWHETIMEDYDAWVQGEMLAGVQDLFPRGTDIAWSEIRALLSDVGRDALVELRTAELFDIIVQYPESQAALLDLKACLNTADQRARVVNVFQKSCKKRLLQGGATTVDIISCYISTIRAFCLVDPRGVLLEKVARPIRRYLKEREDTISVLIFGLLGEPSSDISFLSEELANTRKTQGQAVEDDLADMEWVPDPLDAPPDFRKGLPSDIVGSLISLYENREVFVKEFTAVFANRLLTNRNSVDDVIYHLELLKLRFDERELQNLDVMVKDIVESKRFDAGVRSKSQNISEEFRATILSRLFWPPFKESALSLPQNIMSQINEYSRLFSELKPRRKLSWIPNLGSATIEIEFRNRTQEFLVSPEQAALIGAFRDGGNETVSYLAAELGVGEDAVHQIAAFWVSKGVLKRKGDGYEVLESGDDHENDEDDAPVLQSVQTSEERSAEEMRVYWQYITGMLTNLGCLPTDRIHSFLKMLVPRETPYTKSTHELEQFLLLMVDEGKLESTSAGFKLTKQS